LFFEKGKKMGRKKEKKFDLWQYKWLYFWILIATLFGVGIYFFMGTNHAIDYAGAYLIELSLSVDNLFVFLLIFISFGIDEHAQHRVLFYGIAGTVLLRFLFLFIGISLVNAFEWVLWIFGALLIFSGAKMFVHDEDKDPRDGTMYKAVTRFMPMCSDFVGEKFIVRNDGTNYDGEACPISKKSKWLCTPMMVVMALIIGADIIFAIDSVPAVVSMTTNMFIVYTSNFFAVMGLRQLFFVLEHMHERFQYVRIGVAVILIFTGIKMLLGIFNLHIHNLISIGIIIVILTASIIFSVVKTRRGNTTDVVTRFGRKIDLEEAFKDLEEEE
jgi:tellurite resistance protein TerC